MENFIRFISFYRLLSYFQFILISFAEFVIIPQQRVKQIPHSLLSLPKPLFTVRFIGLEPMTLTL